MIYDSLVAGMWRLVKRRWYVFGSFVAIGVLAAHVLSMNSSHRVEQSVQIGSIEDAGALLDAGRVPKVDVQRLAQQAQLDFDQSESDDEVAATYSSNTTARTVAVTITGSSRDEVNAALLTLNERFSTIASGPITAQIDAGIGNADSTIESLEQAADDVLTQINGQDLDQAALAVVISELSSVRTDISDAKERRGALVGLHDYVEDGFIIFGSSSVSGPARGKTIYVAGALGGATIAALVAAARVLIDRRVRRVAHLERAAPGTRILGVVSAASGAEQSAIDPALRAAVRSFVADHQLSKLVVFGVNGTRGVDSFGKAIEQDVDLPVSISTSDSAGSVVLDKDANVGYVAVARWGATTEDQVSAAVSDITRAGNFSVSLVLIDIPRRDRDWVAAGSRSPLD